MSVESATFISDLSPLNPVHTDGLNQADSHLRLLKSTLQTTLPNLTGAMTATHVSLNAAGTAFEAPGYVQITPNGTVASGVLLLEGVVAGSSVQVANTQTGAGAPGMAILMVQGTTAVAPLSLTMAGVLAVSAAVNAPSIQKGGNELIPTGIIVMWSGLTTTVPAGWHLCDGTNGTPNLVGMFIVGAGAGGPAAGQTGGANIQTVDTSFVADHSHGGATAGVGNHNHGGVVTNFTLGIDHMPSHTHAIFDPSHAHSYTAMSDDGAGAFPNGWGSHEGGGFVGTTAAAPTNIGVYATGGDQPHWHGVYDDGAHAHALAADGGHIHTFGIDVRPTYYAVCLIMKL